MKHSSFLKEKNIKFMKNVRTGLTSLNLPNIDHYSETFALSIYRGNVKVENTLAVSLTVLKFTTSPFGFFRAIYGNGSKVAIKHVNLVF